MTLDAPTGDGETELLPIGPTGVELEAGEAQPADREILQDMADLEHAQHPPGQLTPRIDRRLGVLVLQGALAGDAEARSAKVTAGCLCGPFARQRLVDDSVDALVEPGAVVVIEHHRLLKTARRRA